MVLPYAVFLILCGLSAICVFTFALPFYVIIAGFVTQLSSLEWIAVLICIGLVMALECLNTALESLCNTICPEHSEGIRKTKDASAGAVLCTAGLAVVVGGLIFFRAEKFAPCHQFSRKPTPPPHWSLYLH